MGDMTEAERYVLTLESMLVEAEIRRIAAIDALARGQSRAATDILRGVPISRIYPR